MACASETPTCDICLMEYDVPRMLPCGHSFCSGAQSQCLQELLKAENPECPYRCEKSTNLVDKTIDDFPRNFAITGLARVSINKDF